MCKQKVQIVFEEYFEVLEDHMNEVITAENEKGFVLTAITPLNNELAVILTFEELQMPF